MGPGHDARAHLHRARHTGRGRLHEQSAVDIGPALHRQPVRRSGLRLRPRPAVQPLVPRRAQGRPAHQEPQGDRAPLPARVVLGRLRLGHPVRAPPGAAVLQNDAAHPPAAPAQARARAQGEPHARAVRDGDRPHVRAARHGQVLDHDHRHGALARVPVGPRRHNGARASRHRHHDVGHVRAQVVGSRSRRRGQL